MSVSAAVHILVICLIGLSATANAGTIYVSTAGNDASDGLSWGSAKKTVQAGLNAAQSGDQVWVSAGTYVERITLKAGVGLYGGFARSETDLSQRNWVVNVTTLDGDQGGSVVTGPTGATSSTRIDGFTIRNGKASLGGGLYLYNSSPVISNSTITGNVSFADGKGGGLYLSGSSSTITNNTITGNSVTGAWGHGGGVYLEASSSAVIASNTITANSAEGYGGGIDCSSSSPTITNNTIAGNSAADNGGGGVAVLNSSPMISNNIIANNTVTCTYGYGYGGGLLLHQSPATITNNTITGNSVTGMTGGGGGLYLYSSSAAIRNNVITGNSAVYYGGGLYLDSASPTITNNTIAGNIAHSSSGGALYLASSCSPTIANTIIAYNSPGICQSGTGGSPTLRYNCVYGNTTYNFSGLSDPTGTNGNIRIDPKLADVTHRSINYHIQAASPCRDAGNDADVQSGWMDMDGQARQIGRVDIGADESDGSVWPTVQDIIVRVKSDGDDRCDGSSWDLAKRTVQAGIDAASVVGGEVWVVGGTYYEQITLQPYAHIYGGFAGTETFRDQRDWRVHVTILDGGQVGSVVTGTSLAPNLSTLDGFTIQNGKADRGGGAYLSFSSPVIRNNIIIGNSASTGGGGLCLQYSSPTITNNTIASNNASSYGAGLMLSSSSCATISDNAILDNKGATWGGGMYVNGSCTPRIVNNLLAGNSSSSGGGLYATGSASLEIANNTFSGNSAGSGGGLRLGSSSTGAIIGNTIVANSVSTYGGGIYICDSASPTITNNTIAGNGGSGLAMFSSCNPKVTNTIIALNSSGIYRTGTSTPTLSYNCVFGNSQSDYSGLTDPTGSNGNIKVNPKLADDVYGNYHIQPDSPCRDAGNDGEVQFGWIDMDGQARRNGRVDIGADESYGTLWEAGPYAIVCVKADGDDANDGSSWALAKRTVQAGIDAACAKGGDVWVARGVYAERITLRSYAYVYGGFAGTEDRRDTRNWAANMTILDGGQGGTVVTASDVPAGLSGIDGFTIRNGKSSTGGGLRLVNSCVGISNNTIIGNNASSGSGLYLYRSSPALTNNVVVGNSATSSGGGLYLSSSSPTIIGNTIVSNAAISSGGGMYLDTSSPTIANTILAFNSSGIYQSGTSGSATLRYSCVYANGVYDFSGLADPTGTNGNIQTDPKLVDLPHRNGNYHIQPDSPCKDAGNDADVQAGWIDMDGQTRILGSHVDIGADESDGTVWTPAVDAIVRVSPTGDDTYDGLSWALAKRTVQAGIEATSATGGQVWVARGTYYERITLQPYAHVYGGFAGTETQRDQRDWVNNMTVLDGSQGGSVVTAKGIAVGLSTLDGFTIRNGKASDGAGLYLSSACLTITNNVVTANSAFYNGGGLYLTNSSAMISNNSISSNSADAGSGLYLLNGSPTIRNNTIASNSARISGGGLLLVNSSGATITNNMITSNSASSHSGGMCLSNSSPMISSNVLTGNTVTSSSGYGCGMSLISSSPRIVNNTVIRNTGSSSSCSGIYLSSSSPTIVNTIIAFNSSGIYRYGTSGTATLCYNCVYGNTSYNYSGVADPTGSNGNVSVDPGLVRATAPFDVHLAAGSVCINGGDPAYVPAAGETDTDGQPRKIGACVDIGADEFAWPGDANYDGYVNVGDLQVVVAAWGSQSSQSTGNWDARADVNGDGYVNVGDLQILVANWGEALD